MKIYKKKGFSFFSCSELKFFMRIKIFIDFI
nr:MAG TPA_asm: hypothetical protein [Caudoviricetes sp.]